MKEIINFVLIISACCTSVTGISQISFSDKSFLLSNEDHQSGVSMSIMDMNGDGLDDIVRQNRGVQLNIELQGLPNQEFIEIVGPKTSSRSQWSMCIADVDNDGTNEILTGGKYNEIVIVKVDIANNEFVTRGLPQSNDIFLQGSNFADIDNDGFLDVFGCHDDGESRIWGNDGSGDFTTQDDWINMSVNGSGELASGNYGSAWMDIDNDGDIDLYIAKCRQNVTDVNDVRRINQLYINDGNGNFTEEANSRGLAIGWQSWSAEFQDVNNDGWLDCFITNHDYTSQMLLNDGTGSFVELEETGINVSGFPIQGLLRDFDNDGLVDVITTGSKGQIFKNNGDLTFSEISNLFDEDRMESLALGDLNGDGYLDIYGGYAEIFNKPSDVNDKLWMNEGGTNNYIAVSLEGQQSNRNGIGARIEIYGDWGIQVREVRSGESYGISNSATSYFGLGQSVSIDSLIIKWPSGLIQTEHNIEKNTKLKIVEGECVGISPTFTYSGALVFCPGDSLTVSSDEGFDSYLWSDGSNGNTITIKNTGLYNVNTIDSLGCLGFSESLLVTVDPILYPEIVANGPLEICEGETIDLEELNLNIDANLIVWSNGDGGYSTTIGSTGTYSAIATGLCSDFESNSIEVIVNEIPDIPEATGDSINLGEIAVLNGVGDQLVWYDMQNSISPIGYGESIEIEGLIEDATFYVEDKIGSGYVDRVGMEDHEGTLYTENPDATDMIRFNASEAFTLDSVTVYTDLPGLREITFLDQIYSEIETKKVFIEEGESTIYLGFEVQPGLNYRLATGITQNFATTGNFGPRLRRSDENVNFPYTLDNVVTLTGAEFGQGFYYYFYDWKISAGSFCVSDRIGVDVVVKETVSTIDDENQSINVYPNPSNGKLTLQFLDDNPSNSEYSIMDLSGKLIYKDNVSNRKEVLLDLNLMPGVYILQILDGNEIYKKKIVIQ